MNKHKLIKFKIDDSSHFELRIPYAHFKYCGYAEIIKVFFYIKNYAPTIILRNDTLFSALLYFKEMTKRLLSKELIVDQNSLTRGIAYNQSLAYYTAQGYSDEAEHERYKWGLYSLFANPENNSVWLYECNNEFYLEISSLYCALPTNTKQKFAHFMKDYKPKFVKKISPAIVQKWHKQSSTMLEHLKENHERMTKERVIGQTIID